MRYRDVKQNGERKGHSPDPHRPYLLEISFEQRLKPKRSVNSKEDQLVKKNMNNDASSSKSLNQNHQHKGFLSTSINQNQSSDQITFESGIKQNESINQIFPQTKNYENFENNSAMDVIDMVEQKVKKIANVFGSTVSITNFLEKTKELKIIPNISQLNHTNDLFSNMILEIQHIHIRNYFPKNLNQISNPIIQQRLKSMKQARTFELAVNYMQNEFNVFNSKILKISEDFDHPVFDRIETLSKENEKLREKVSFLHKILKEKNENLKIDEETEKKNLILGINKLYKQITTEKEKNVEELAQISEKFDKFFESREKLLSSYNLINRQIKKLEKAKFSIFEKNAKTVTIKGKVYNEKMIDDEIAQFISKKENILSGLDKIEAHETKFLSVLK